MFCLRVADERGVTFAIIFFPIGELSFAVPVAHGAQELTGGAFRRTVPQRIQADRYRNFGQGIDIGRLLQHRRLTVQPHQVTEEAKNDQASSAGSYGDLQLRKFHGKHTLGQSQKLCSSLERYASAAQVTFVASTTPVPL